MYKKKPYEASSASLPRFARIARQITVLGKYVASFHRKTRHFTSFCQVSLAEHMVVLSYNIPELKTNVNNARSHIVVHYSYRQQQVST